MESMYVCKSNSGWLYEMRQVRFLETFPEHPYDLCAVAHTVEEMHSMSDKYWPNADYSRAETRFSELKERQQ